MDGSGNGADQSSLKLFHLLPNLLTIAAICAGMSAIRSGYEGQFDMAVRLVLAACVLDGLDGRVARMMNRSTAVGAELDSLADFLNFGVAPVLILHSWAFQDFRNTGWIAVLIYAICCVLRLARFNVSSRTEDAAGLRADCFVGVPSPAGAILVLLPMFCAFAFPELPVISPVPVAIYTVFIGLLMISEVPTFSFKNKLINRESAKYVLLLAAALAAALFTYLWATLTFLALAYFVSIIWVWRRSSGRNKRVNNP